MGDLELLLRMRNSARVREVALDLRRKHRRYSTVAPHDLAEALGVPEPSQPGSEWSFTSYAPRRSAEEYAMYDPPASELLYRLKSFVSVARFKDLLKRGERLDRMRNPKMGFLTAGERMILEDWIAKRDLDRNLDNGMSCLAHFNLRTPGGNLLRFEGEVEDTGECFNLRTPYDYKDGRFVDLRGAVVTTAW
jgi:hypothetical protein